MERKKLVTLEESALKYLETLRANGDTLVKLGIPGVDYALGGGVEFGELVLFAARPSHGKSATGLQMTHKWTEDALPCLFISEEMSAMALGKRGVHYASEVPAEDWERDFEEVNEQTKLHFANREVCYVAESCRTPEAAVEQIKFATTEHGVRCVVVDYAQLLTSQGKQRYEQVTHTSICLRQAANEFKIVLVALCQLNRDIENRERFEPRLSDLRDTGQLEQDADVIVFCVWPHKIDPKADPHEYKFYIAKNRNRAINQHVVFSRFEPSRQRFVPEKLKYQEFEDFGKPEELF